ncbi:ras specific guanine nucleotide releasing factor [Trichuris trichiura]|uniref:Ras specific guanine nucleotide releasing factor n=1 Tax=Trichuris trichiura TaxID=36087 RepID=A0A077ZDM1_TRITR|nr:ras specific guanine nucleotide releasing factor [Trichuris trichiura]
MADDRWYLRLNKSPGRSFAGLACGTVVKKTRLNGKFIGGYTLKQVEVYRNIVLSSEVLEKCSSFEMTLEENFPEMIENLSSHCRAEEKQFDPVTFNVLKVSVEEIAAQLTLGDLPIFKAIRPEELTSCAWNSRNKLQVAPNVVAFIRRFNHVCLWCQKEVLNCESLKFRTEMLSHFIKIAKKLIELNNIHSAFAIVSGLQSNAIYRLRRTWIALSSKDKLTFERLVKLFSDSSNWERLRKYMETIKLPCIPYLGLYLTDFVYIDIAHPSSGGLESTQRSNLMNNILRVLADYQCSTYDNLNSIGYFQKYLDSIRYIDELQNLSVKLEPNQALTDSTENALDRLATSSDGFKSLSLTPQSSKSKQSHRKTQSLGGSNLPRRLVGIDQNDTFPFNARRHLLDDSLLEFSSCTASSSSLQMAGTDHVGDSGHESAEETFCRDSLSCYSDRTRDHSWRKLNMLNDECIIEGPVRRKTILKWGRKPQVSFSDVSAGIPDCIFVDPCMEKTLGTSNRPVPIFARGSSFAPQFTSSHCRKHCFTDPLFFYKAHADRVISLCGWMVVMGENPFMPDSFMLQEPAQGHVYRFRVGTQARALQWAECLKKACEDPRKKV